MRKLTLYLLCIVMPIFLLVSFCSGVGKMEIDRSRDCTVDNSPSGTVQAATSLRVGGLTVKSQKPSVEQLGIINMFGQLARKSEHPLELFLVLFTGAAQESNIRNITYGYFGSSSVGVWQQIASWGSFEDRTNPQKSTQLFLNALFTNKDWYKLSPGAAVQRVQRSDPAQLRFTNPELAEKKAIEAYEQHLPEARAWAKKILGYQGVTSEGSARTTAAADCDDTEKTDRIEEMVRAAEALQGARYRWDDATGAEMIAAAAKRGDITLPNSVDKMAEYRGKKSEGVTGKWIPQSEIATAAANLKRGDIVFYTAGGKTHAAIYTGATGGLIRIGSFNVRGASHEGNNWPGRLQKTMAEISEHEPEVLGLQEFQRPQREAFLNGRGTIEGLGDVYDIFPKTPTYGPGNRTKSVNSIVWDKSRFELVEGRYVAMPCYFGGCNFESPAVLLKEISSGDKYWFLNFHDPAFERNEAKRLRNANDHVVRMKQLHESGYPVIATGDFNSGFRVRTGTGNTTVGDERSNLTWCVMTRSGDIRNAADVAAGRTGACPEETSKDGDVQSIDHIYATDDVEIENFEVIDKPKSQNGTDHPLVLADAAASLSRTRAGGKIISASGPGQQIDLRSVPAQLLGALRLTATEEVPAVSDPNSWVFPLAKGTYHFNPRSYGPGMSGHTFHNGSDFGTSGAQPQLVAMHTGKIIRVGWGGAWGNYFMVETGIPVKGKPDETYKYLYAHMSRYESGLKLGDSVALRQPVGNVGDTGNSFGDHLHLNICTDVVCTYGSSVGSEGTVDPIPFLESVGVKP